MCIDETCPLLDRLAKQLGCLYLSDLKYLDPAKQADLVRALNATPTGAASLQQWNDALSYLTSQPGAGSRAEARDRLLAALTE